MHLRRISLAGACVVALAQTAEEPVGLVLGAGGGAQIQRRAGEAVAARAGEMLFTGDRLRTGAAPASYLYCPGRASERIEAESEALFGAAEVKITRGRAAGRQAVAACFLPPVVVLGVASRQHAGALVLRETPPVPKLAAPLGAPVLDMPPRFAWEKAGGADAYQVEILDAAGKTLWKTEVAGTEVRYPGHAPPLVAPSTYRWRVTASAGGRVIGTTESSFQALRAAERMELRKQIADLSAIYDHDSSNPALRLARAAVLERRGLLAQALQDYQSLVAVWKEAPWLKERIFQLEQALRAAERSVTTSTP